MKRLFLGSLLLVFTISCKAPLYSVTFVNHSGVPVDILSVNRGATIAPGIPQGGVVKFMIPEVRKGDVNFVAQGRAGNQIVGTALYQIPSMSVGYDGFYYPPPKDTVFVINRLTPLTQWENLPSQAPPAP